MVYREGEAQVLDYQTQQYKLFPLLAASYAFWLSGLKMRHTYFSLNYELMHGNMDLLPEVTASATWTNSELPQLLCLLFIGKYFSSSVCFIPY